METITLESDGKDRYITEPLKDMVPVASRVDER